MITMTQIIRLLQDRQGDKSPPEFCVELGLSNQSTLLSFYNGTRNIGLATGRKIAAYAHDRNDTELKHAITQYLTGVPE